MTTNERVGRDIPANAYTVLSFHCFPPKEWGERVKYVVWELYTSSSLLAMA